MVPIRFRNVYVLLPVFALTQVVLFGVIFSRKCSYLSWLWRGCKEEKPLCPLISPHLKGTVEVETYVPAWQTIEDNYPMLQNGGRYQPPDCKARHRVALIIPFRDRDIHLKILLNNLHAFLMRQQLDYGIFLIDLEETIPFNRALLLNVGFLEANKVHDYQCYVFHDVDLIPENDHNMYSCPEQPRHMSVAIDKMNYRLPYTQIFGGVSAMTREQMLAVNGYSNRFFGWGGEDDDMYNRLKYHNLTISRYTGDVARYKMLSHRRDEGNPQRFALIKSEKKHNHRDGLSTLKYTVTKMVTKRLYTYIRVSVDQKRLTLGHG
ncbi:beta-1,4-N-acetylgalactosaminyltransferase bre-4-like [Saccostrea echinata]|uniref:beta-1,4-N-acetylgalactosaminyltransferase bre-4-like n=1 Tax=Saccostrea echinata TaxID=191078 RepID=UPI002A8343CE|nr:beta-1,4-N-acetylgalactosaminyltransferase bre-4-like [Saccostrea echinata]